MKYKIEVTEKQMLMLEKCTELYMRLMMGQTIDLANELAFYNYEYQKNPEAHSAICEARDHINEVLKAVMRIAFYKSGYGVPEQKSEDCMIAECLWDSIRCAQGRSRWGEPFQIGSEPIPKIEEVMR